MTEKFCMLSLKIKKKCVHACTEECPQKKIDSFFAFNTPDDAKRELLNMMIEAYSCPGKSNTPIEMSNSLFFYKQLGDLIDVAHKLSNVKFMAPEGN